MVPVCAFTRSLSYADTVTTAAPPNTTWPGFSCTATLARYDLSWSRRTSGDTRSGEAHGLEVFVVLVVHAGLTSTPVLVVVFCGQAR